LEIDGTLPHCVEANSFREKRLFQRLDVIAWHAVSRND
jgi:hypothetical protein